LLRKNRSKGGIPVGEKAVHPGCMSGIVNACSKTNMALWIRGGRIAAISPAVPFKARMRMFPERNFEEPDRGNN
jgi:hypothetical protein